MKVYIIVTVSNNKEWTNIEWDKQHIFLTREPAFEKLKEIGNTGCVIELTQTKSWNMDQLEDEEWEG